MDKSAYRQQVDEIFQKIDAHRPTKQAPLSARRLTRMQNRASAFCVRLGVWGPLAFSAMTLEISVPALVMGAGLIAAYSLDMPKAGIASLANRFYPKQLNEEQQRLMLHFASRFPRVIDTMSQWLAANDKQQFTHAEWQVIHHAYQQLRELNSTHSETMGSSSEQDRNAAHQHLQARVQALRLGKDTPLVDNVHPARRI